MNGYEIKSLFEEVFFEDRYEIIESTKIKYGNVLPLFYLKRYSDRLKCKISCMVIHNYIIGTTIVDDAWEIILENDITILIPGTSIKRNPKDVGDTKAFVNLLKEKVEEYFRIKEIKDNFNKDIRLMKTDPIKIIRDYKLKNILI